jgi:hypothetical protein
MSNQDATEKANEDLLEALRTGNFVVAAPEEVLQGLEETLQGHQKPDFTVTHAELRDTWDHEKSYGMSIAWGTKSAGFGELTIAVSKETSTLRIDSEGMSPRFCKEVMSMLIDNAFAEKPILREQETERESEDP